MTTNNTPPAKPMLHVLADHIESEIEHTRNVVTVLVAKQDARVVAAALRNGHKVNQMLEQACALSREASALEEEVKRLSKTVAILTQANAELALRLGVVEDTKEVAS